VSYETLLFTARTKGRKLNPVKGRENAELFLFYLGKNIKKGIALHFRGKL
jgi:hypothetical protein